MIKIDKAITPQYLAQFSSEPLDIKEPFHDSKIKRRLKSDLYREQKGLCAYCMSRISVEDNVIEHIKPKSNFKYKDLSRKYSNLVLTCKHMGGTNTHCDESKKENELGYVPLVLFSEVEKYIKYDKDGTIIGQNLQLNNDLNSYKLLNLNGTTYLKRNRREVIRNLEVIINDFILLNKNRVKIRNELCKLLRNEVKADILTPYSGVLRYVINEYLKIIK